MLSQPEWAICQTTLIKSIKIHFYSIQTSKIVILGTSSVYVMDTAITEEKLHLLLNKGCLSLYLKESKRHVKSNNKQVLMSRNIIIYSADLSCKQMRNWISLTLMWSSVAQLCALLYLMEHACTVLMLGIQGQLSAL